MNTKRMKHGSRGFSMVEVMISVVVLGFGLMALAALQTSLIRSSVETKAQTVALQLAKDKLEDLRSFGTLVGYQAVTTGADTINDSNGNLGGVDYSRAWTVTRFGYQPSAGTFAPIATLTGPTPAANASGVAFTANNEYKRVAITVSWTDANGSTQSIGLEDAIGAVSPGDGSKVVLNNTGSFQTRKPQVLVYNPGLVGGVIPIALGGNKSTAASNPVPILDSKGTAVQETHFKVLTYAGVSGNVLLQSQVETAVVSCTCSTANKPSTKAYRPTYWNGYRYASPTATSGNAIAGWTGSSTESDRCNACCRDHHDPSGVSGPKFDPWRLTHDHYRRSGTTLNLANTGTYDEACRLIRVDGFYRVASDLRNDYFGFLEANNNNDLSNSNQTLRSYAPRVDKTVVANDAVTNYQNFVLKYMDDRFSNNLSFTYNTPLAVAGYESSYGLNKPTDGGNPSAIPPVPPTPLPISIKPSATSAVKSKDGIWANNDSKWTHARGLFVDYIEPDALDVIKEARSKCADKATQALRNACVLPYVPFTSINLTELADYRSVLTKAETETVSTQTASDGTVIKVVNNAFNDLDPTNPPTRGNVYAGSFAQANKRAFAVSFMAESNSAVALRLPIDPEETVLRDSQEYLIGTGSVPTPNSFNITLQMSGHGDTTPYPSVKDYETGEFCIDPKDYPTTTQTCTLKPDTNGVVRIQVGAYTKSQPTSIPNGCRNSGTTTLTIIKDYSVLSGQNFTKSLDATVSIPSNDKTALDSTVLSFTNTGANDVLKVVLSGPTYWCPSNYNKEGNTVGGASPPASLVCTGSGSNANPTWSQELKVCPSGTPGT